METKLRINLVEDYNDPETGTPCVCIDVRNVGEVPTGKLEMMFEYEYEAPQPVSQQTDLQHNRKVTVQVSGRRLGFAVAGGQNSEVLESGQTRLFIFPNKWLPKMQSIMASLSPERYRVVTSDHGVIRPAIPGVDFGIYVERLFGLDE